MERKAIERIMFEKHLLAIVIDDEKDARSFLKSLIDRVLPGKVSVIAEAEDLSAGVKKILRHQPDLVFLDIDMPGEFGIKITEYFEKPTFSIVYTTAYKEYALQALKHNAADYLLKPINIVELRDCINRIVELRKNEGIYNKLHDKINLLAPIDKPGKQLMLKTNYGFYLENTKNIVLCKSEGMYTTVQLFSGREILVSKPLKKLREIFPDNDFFKTHQSYLVNINYIRRFVKADNAYLEMRNDIRVPVASRIVASITEEIEKRLIK